MRIPCPTCNRLGTVNKAMPAGTVMGYCGPNGERWPQETCQTCAGSGWIEEASATKRDDEIAVETAEELLRKLRG